MSWVLTTGLKTVRDEFNEVFPTRDKTTDGSVGDLRHQTGVSGHNPDRTGKAEYKDGDSVDEVRAIDVDRDLVPKSDVDWMAKCIQHIITRARSGQFVPFQYVIYKGRIASASTGWGWRTYQGANPHDKHAHFSGGRSQKADNWTGSLGLATVKKAVMKKKHNKVDLDGFALAEVKYGDDDRDFEGYWTVQRLQRLLGLVPADCDGRYGDQTTNAVKAAMKKADATKFAKHDGRKVGITEWRIIAGIFVG